MHYLPNYESVLHSTRRFTWKSDLRHVTEPMVERITGVFSPGRLEAAPAGKPGVEPASDWPIQHTEIEEHPGVPKFFSATPGDPRFSGRVPA